MAPYQFIERAYPVTGEGDNRPVWLVAKGGLDAAGLPAAAAAWGRNAGFTGAEGSHLLVPDAEGNLTGCLFGTGDAAAAHPFAVGKLATVLPQGVWRLEGSDDAMRDSLAFALGGYRFETYRKPGSERARLALADGLDTADLARIASGVDLARDLINTPANDLGPAALEDVFRAVGSHYGAAIAVIAGDDLLAQNFPMIHAVGRAAADAPRLLDMRWGKPGAPKITLVGKGVCFDTGGLDIKPSSSMLLMKKDMGGAANVLGLASMIMDAGLEVDLRVLVPAVENAVAGNAFRPGDILKSRKGLSVQIDNTDAEGRLVLGDALTYACEDAPELIVDMATLTGAARVALGPDLPPYYTEDETLAGDLAAAAAAVADPLWRMPLYRPYDAMLDVPAADLTNAPAGGFGGSITAALFLRRFVEKEIAWCHLDIFGWTPKAQPHAPVGGQAQGIRALYHLLKQRYAA
jgi:leucyl aminopeptidase